MNTKPWSVPLTAIYLCTHLLLSSMTHAQMTELTSCYVSNVSRRLHIKQIARTYSLAQRPTNKIVTTYHSRHVLSIEPTLHAMDQFHCSIPFRIVGRHIAPHHIIMEWRATFGGVERFVMHVGHSAQQLVRNSSNGLETVHLKGACHSDCIEKYEFACTICNAHKITNKWSKCIFSKRPKRWKS